MMHQNCEQQIVIIDDAVALIARAKIDPSEQGSDADVHADSQMCQGLVPFTFNYTASDQNFQLIHFADFIVLHTLVGQWMFVSELLQFHDSMGILEPLHIFAIVN